MKVSKLYNQIIEGRAGAISFRDFERLITAFGLVHERTSGSHHVYKSIKAQRSLIVQPRNGEAKPYQIRQFLDIVEEYGLEMD